jgi:hypothetical protein
MLKFVPLFLLVALPLFLKAQPSLWSNDSVSKRIMETDCDGKIFTRVEQLPSLKISIAKFEDTLTSLLKSKKAFQKTNRLIFKFIITSQSQMFDLTREFGEIKKENVVKACIQNFANLWLPAIQNGHTVCSYVRLDMSIQEDKLSIKIVQ